MKTYQRLLLVIALALTVSALVSPWAVLSWATIIESYPGWQGYGYPFARIFDRVFMLSAIGLFLVFRKRLKFGSLRELGLLPMTSNLRQTRAVRVISGLMPARSVVPAFAEAVWDTICGRGDISAVVADRDL